MGGPRDASGTADDGASPERPVSVLVVDDDELARLHLKLTLSHEALAVRDVASGEQALELLRHQRFDIVLMDVRMPGLDGFTTCERLRQLPGQAATPVVMLTATEDAEAMRRAGEVGAVAYVIKPPKARVLARRLRRIVQAQRNRL